MKIARTKDSEWTLTHSGFIYLGEHLNEDDIKPKEFVQRFLQNRKEYTTVVYKTRVGTHTNHLVKIFAKNDILEVSTNECDKI